jgi:hypothetical protein
MNHTPSRSQSVTNTLIGIALQAGIALIRAAAVLAVWPWQHLTRKGRLIAGTVLALVLCSNWLLTTFGALPLLATTATASGLAWRHHHTRARRTPLGQTTTEGGRSLLLLTSMAAEHVPPYEMASMLTTARTQGWKREVAEIHAAITALASTPEVAHLVWVQELRRAETTQGTWRPAWLAGPPALTTTNPTRKTDQ